MDRDEGDRHKSLPRANQPIATSDAHRKWALIARRLNELLVLYDALDEGDCQSAADAERALHEAKRILRTKFGLAPVDAHLQPRATILSFPVPSATLMSAQGDGRE